jgi:hypothetical protein
VLGDNFVEFEFKIMNKKKVIGGAGYRSRYLSHAKRALYHLSYAPVPTNELIFKQYTLLYLLY